MASGPIDLPPICPRSVRVSPQFGGREAPSGWRRRRGARFGRWCGCRVVTDANTRLCMRVAALLCCPIATWQPQQAGSHWASLSGQTWRASHVMRNLWPRNHQPGRPPDWPTQPQLHFYQQNQNQLLPTPRHLRAPLSLFFGSPGKGKRKLVVKGGGLTATSTTAFAGASAFPHDPCWCAGSEEKKIQCTMKLCSETLVLADERSEHSIFCPGRAPAAVVLSAEKHLVAFWSIRCPKNARDSVDWADTTARIAAVPCSSCITDCIVTATIVGRQVLCDGHGSHNIEVARLGAGGGLAPRPMPCLATNPP